MTVTYHRERNHSKCSQFLLLALRHAIKQSRHWSIDSSMKLCWLLTIFQSDAISAHGHNLLVSDKHVPVFRFQSYQTLVHWYCFHAARGESEWCILLWCLAAQTVAAIHLASCWWLLLSSAPHVHKSTELLWHKTLDFTLNMWPPINRPDLNPVDYRKWISNAFIRNSKCRHTSPISCGY